MPSFFENRSPNSHRPVHQTQTNTANTNNNSKDRVTQPKGTQRLLMDANDKAVSSTSRSEGVASKGPAKREGEANNNNPNNNGAKKSIFDRLVKKGNNPSSVGPSLGVRPRDRSLQAESGAGDLVTKRLRVDQVGKSIITNTQNTITRPKPAIASLRAPPHAAPQRPPRPAMPPNAMHAPIPAAPKDEENKGGELAFGGHGDAGQGDDPNAKYKKKRCRDWPGCQKPDCAFHHPKDPCPYFPKCSFGDRCLYIHPQIECRFGVGCQRPDCAYTHPHIPAQYMYAQYPGGHPSLYRNRSKIPRKPGEMQKVVGNVGENPGAGGPGIEGSGPIGGSDEIQWTSKSPAIIAGILQIPFSKALIDVIGFSYFALMILNLSVCVCVNFFLAFAFQVGALEQKKGQASRVEVINMDLSLLKYLSLIHI
eukprot:TRINITY_DN6126_c0_g1_i1.p1 TRINITY_DN6126_c0_g1~~TRINITY_DN6126_c0_g1_i1.p1  ORF type:complete len:422 (-),score=51.58 TRINITY_DN6126_c0_g1_i1:61-1326(-)